jgi:tetratricopeptide (TPR) repeat protein
VSDEKPRSRPPSRAPGGPPRLERVPAGRASPKPAAPEARPAAQRPAPPPVASAPGAAYGLAAPEVGADAAIAASIPHQGTLAADGPLRLFSLAAALQATGRLAVSAEQGQGAASALRWYALFFRRGTVEHASSSDPGDDLGRFLVRKGALGEAQRARAEAASAAVGGDLAAALIAEKLMNPADVAALLQEHGANIVQRALSLTAGGWSWTPSAPPPPGAFPLGAPLAMLCAAVRTLDAAALVARLGDREHRAASRIGGRIRLEDLRLTAQEARAAGLFDGVRSPAEVAAASAADAVVVLRVALLLGEVDLLAFGASRKGRRAAAPPPPPPPAAPGPASAKPAVAPRPPPPAAAPPPQRSPPAAEPATTPAPMAPPPAPRAAASPGLQAGAVEALLKKVSAADHFEALGVQRSATQAQIKLAYFQLAKTYHPDAVPADALPEIRKLCADVFARLSDAWSVLGEDATRHEYLEALKGGGVQRVDVMNIFRAETVFEEATLLAKARRYAEALQKCDEAIRLYPEEPEFGIWKAFCEFALAPDKRASLEPSTAAIEAGLKRNPRCAQGYVFLGQMAKLVGELGIAEKHLRRGLAAAPENQDLQRELKYLKK